MKTLTNTLLAGAVLLLAPTAALADAGHGHGAAHGKPGKASQVSRTVTVTMHDNYYEPEAISVAKGETVRFTVKNAGSVVHEFNIGTPAMHAAHQDEMLMMVDHGVLEVDRINYDAMKMTMDNGETMEHDDPNSALLEPGKSAELIWTFATDAELEFACNVPGHYDSGMVGAFELE